MGLFTRRKDIERLEGELTTLKQSNAELENVAKSLSMKDPTLARIFNWQDINNDTPSLNRPYSQLPAVHSCIKWKARNFAQVPYKIYAGEKEIAKGPVVDLFNEINPTLDPFQFWEGISTSLDMAGNAYIILDEEYRKGLPTYLWLFNPGWIDPAYDNSGVWVGWWLRRGGSKEKEFLPPERVIQLKYYNPNNEILGLSPVEVLKITNETLWNAQLYNKKFFENDATPNTAYTHEGRLSERQKDQIQKKLIDDRKGAKHTHSAQILSGGWDVKTVGLAQKDIQFLELIKAGREDIAMIYGVPKKILGLYEDINMATAKSAELQFWEDTVIPVARMAERAINKTILAPFGYEGRFDFSAIDVLNERVLEKVEAVNKLLATGQFTRNELNRKFNLGFDDVPWGDEPISLFPDMPEPEPADKAPPMIPVAPTPEPEKISLDEAHMADKWAKDIVPLVPIMSRAAKSVRDYFHGVEQTIMKSLTKKVKGDYVMKMALTEVPVEEIEKAFSDDALYKALEPYMIDAMERGIKTIIQTGFTMDNAEALRILAAKRIKVIEMNNTAKTQIVEELREVLKDGLAEGVGQDELARRIVEGLTGQMKNIKKRSATIARTEVNNSFSEARWASIEEDPPKYIRWISSRDSKVRDSHNWLDGKVVRYGESFPNGCKFPHDPNGAAEEVINCRCTWEPVYFDEE
jgi:HK97 family phage portal protein